MIGKKLLLGGAFAAVLLGGGSVWAQNYGMFMNPLEERAYGVRAHPAALAEAGGAYPDAKLTAYVVALSKRIAQGAAKHPDQFVFNVTNDPDVNAFTNPGGFVYINIGMIAWVNDEAELAALIGHEVGHAINRHAAKKIARRNVSKAGYKLGMISRRFREQAPEIKEALMLKNIAYSQDAELEADQVGFAADGKLGLDTLGAARMLYQLQKQRDWYASFVKQTGDETPPYLQSHPQPLDRVKRAVELAQQQGGTNLPRNRDRFLDTINGLRLPYKSDKGTVYRYVRVVTVKPGETAQTLAKRVSMASPLAHLLAINGLDSPDQVKPGMRIKLVTAS